MSLSAEATILIADSADGPSRIELVLHFNGLALRGGYIGGKGNEQIASDTLLDGNPRSRVLAIGGTQGGIDLQLRNAGHLCDLAANLAGDSGCYKRFRPK